MVIRYAMAFSGVYPATHAHDMANICFNFKMNCCAGSSITIGDLISGEPITFYQSSHGTNSSCANDVFIV